MITTITFIYSMASVRARSYNIVIINAKGMFCNLPPSIQQTLYLYKKINGVVVLPLHLDVI